MLLFCVFSFPRGAFTSRQLPVPAAVYVAEVLEYQPEPGAQPALPGTRTPQVLATGDHGGGDLQRPKGRAFPQSSGKVRFQAAMFYRFLNFLKIF